MSKEWKCGDCCYFGTDSCSYGVMESNACNHIVVDHDKAYEQGSADAIDKAIKVVRLIGADEYTYNEIMTELEQLKEQK